MGNEATYGTEEALKIARLEYNNIKAVHAFSRKHSIPCQSAERPTVDVVYDRGEWEAGLAAIARMKGVMDKEEGSSQYTIHDAKATAEKFYSPGAMGAFEYPAGSLSAYKFVIGVLNICLKRGLNLQTGTPVTGISPASSADSKEKKWIVETPRGSILSSKTILATNAYTAHLLPAFQGVIVPLRGQIAAQRPGLNMPKAGLETTYSFIYDGGYEYMIPLPAEAGADEHTIVIGGGLTKTANDGEGEFGNTDDTALNDDCTKYLRETCVAFFGKNWGEDDPKGRIVKEWSGVMGFSSDGQPHVGEVPGEEGLYISASFQGHGMFLLNIQISICPHSPINYD
jgi:glycine/D-amino acid oxidase-like deaminating enzyme